MIRACQQSTGWEEAIKNAISRRNRWLDELKALTAEYTAATIAEYEAPP
jgi:flavin-binding protein dodecin